MLTQSGQSLFKLCHHFWDCVFDRWLVYTSQKKNDHPNFNNVVWTQNEVVQLDCSPFNILCINSFYYFQNSNLFLQDQKCNLDFLKKIKH